MVPQPSIPINVGKIKVEFDEAQLERILTQAAASAEAMTHALNSIAVAIASLMVTPESVQINGGKVQANQ